MIPGYRGIVRDDAAARGAYAEAAGIGRIVPAMVAVPADAGDVQALVRWAASAGRTLTPRGSGSSMSGGAIGHDVVVDLSRLSAIGTVDASARRVRVGPGALCADVMAVALQAGLRFPVDPSSAPFCTIGGMVGTNAAGPHSLRSGAMRRWVHALECVLADGSAVRIERGSCGPFGSPILDRFLAMATAERRGRWSQHCARPGVRKNSSGYALAEFAASGDLVDLVVGSEGTLAVVTAVELRLEAVPAGTATALVQYASLEGAAAGASAAREAGAAVCELLDRTFLDFAGIDHGGAEAILICETEDAGAATAVDILRLVRDACLATGAASVREAVDADASHEIWSLRHAASPLLSRLDPSLRSMQFIEDGAVPPARLADYIQSVRDGLTAARIRGVIFGHAGDAHVHVNPLVPIGERDWRDRVESLLGHVAAATGQLGGTLAGEHGDGRIRAPLLPQTWSAIALAEFAAVKQAFDPHGLLNPGVKVALPGQRAIDQVKYDPTLEPLAPAASAALATVDRERAYARFRLDLVGGPSGRLNRPPSKG